MIITSNTASSELDARMMYSDGFALALPFDWTYDWKVFGKSNLTTRLHLGTSRPSSTTLVAMRRLNSCLLNFLKMSSCFFQLMSWEESLAELPTAPCPTTKLHFTKLSCSSVTAKRLRRSFSKAAVYRRSTKTIPHRPPFWGSKKRRYL